MSKQSKIAFNNGKILLVPPKLVVPLDQHADPGTSAPLDQHSKPPSVFKKQKKMMNSDDMDQDDLPDQSTRPKVQLTYPNHLLHGFPYQPAYITFDQDPRVIDHDQKWCPWWSLLQMDNQNIDAWWLRPITLLANIVDPCITMIKQILRREFLIEDEEMASITNHELDTMTRNLLFVMLVEPPSHKDRCFAPKRLVDIPKLFNQVTYDTPSCFQPVLYIFDKRSLVHIDWILPEPQYQEAYDSPQDQVIHFNGEDEYGRYRLSRYGVPPTPTDVYEWHDNDDLRKCALNNNVDLTDTPKRLLGGNTSCLTDYRQRRFIIPKSNLNLMVPSKFKVYGIPSHTNMRDFLEPWMKSQPILNQIRWFDTMAECEKYAAELNKAHDPGETIAFWRQVQEQWIDQDDYVEQYAIHHPDNDGTYQIDQFDPTSFSDDNHDHDQKNQSNTAQTLHQTVHDCVGYALTKDLLVLWLFLEHLQHEFRLHVDQNLVKIQSIGIFFETPEQLTEKLPNYLERCAQFIDETQDQTQLYNYQTGQMDVWKTKSELMPIDWQVLSTLLVPEPMRSYLIVYYDQSSKSKENSELRQDDEEPLVFARAIRNQSKIYHKAAPLSGLQQEQILDAYYWVHMAPVPNPIYQKVLNYYEERGYMIRIKHGYVRTGRHSGRCSASGHRRNYDPIRQTAYSIPSKYTKLDENGRVVALVRQPRPTKSKYAHLARQKLQTPFEYDLFNLGIKDNLKRPDGEIEFLMKSVHHRHKQPHEIMPIKSKKVYTENKAVDGQHQLSTLAEYDHKLNDPQEFLDPFITHQDTDFFYPIHNQNQMFDIMQIPPIDAGDEPLDSFKPIAYEEAYSQIPDHWSHQDTSVWENIHPVQNDQSLWPNADNQELINPSIYAHLPQMNVLDDQDDLNQTSSNILSCEQNLNISQDIAKVFAWKGKPIHESNRQSQRRHYKKKNSTIETPLNISAIIPVIQPTDESA